MNIAAVILARKGSKRLPNKNIMKLCGKPMICYAIDEALKVAEIQNIIISTDDDEVRKIAKEYQGKFTHIKIVKRPEILCDDRATSEAAMMHAVKKIKRCEYAMLLQPTSPLRTKQDIEAVIRIAKDSGKGCIMTKNIMTGTNNGAVFMVKLSEFINNPSLKDNNAELFYMMPDERSVDIDTVQDFERATELMGARP
jgi:CMP-N-acetylneuraminic acid synthetase